MRYLSESIHAALVHSTFCRMPVLFIGHGSPLHAINGSVYAKAWGELGDILPQPRVIVCMSAHWLTDGVAVTGKKQHTLLYDFYGFPPELYTVTYGVRGDRTVLSEMQALLPELHIDVDRGLDHGVWVVLKHLFPEANIPVVALSIDIRSDRASVCANIARLMPLRDQGVLFIGSGNSTHNLAHMHVGAPHAWASRFDMQIKQLIENKDMQSLIGIESLSLDARDAVPTDDHYRPLLNALALTDSYDMVHSFNEAIDLGSIGMRSFVAVSRNHS